MRERTSRVLKLETELEEGACKLCCCLRESRSLSGDGIRLCVLGPCGIFRKSGNRESEDECCPAAEFTFDADLAAMRVHDMTGDGETEAGPAGFARPRLVHAVEALKDAALMLKRDTGTEVLHV